MVTVLGGFGLFWGASVRIDVPRASQRLLALLALHGGVISRAAVAGTLWPDASESHAYSNLRSALSRLGRTARNALAASKLDLGLAEGVTVDFCHARALARRLLDPAMTPDRSELGTAAVAALSADLLPAWYDDWVLVEAEGWRQLRLHALEALAARLTAAGRWGEAAGAAGAAVRAEPLSAPSWNYMGVSSAWSVWLGRRRRGIRQAPQEAERMAGRGRNERCPCGSGRKVKHCCGVRRGPSEAQLAKAWLHQQARSAALALAERSDAQVVALLEEAARLPRQDVSMQLPLPRLLSPALERLRATVAEGDPHEVDAAVPAALAEVDTPTVRAELVRAVLGLRDAGRVSAEVAAAVAAEQASRSTTLLEASLLAAVRVSVGAATTPAGLLVVSRL